MKNRIRVWDLPTRLFHWSFATAFIGAFIATSREWLLDYHVLSGALVLGLAAFRLVWGFSGNRNARFSQFVRGWKETKGFISALLRLSPPKYPGHNPAVAWVVLLMLLLALVLAATGIVVYSGEEMRGPFVGVFSFEAAQKAAFVHSIAAYSFLAVAVVHVTAALLHDLVWKEGLIFSMITGWKEAVGVHDPFVPDRPVLKKTAFAVLAAVTAGAVFVVLPVHQGSSDATVLLETHDGTRPLEKNALYDEECGSCHNAFSPTLLPAASWERVMAGLDDHFGDDASLPEETSAEILAWLMASSAERAFSEPSKKILRSIGGNAPLRITGTPYWKEKHSNIEKDVYSRKSVSSRTNCAACHPGAPLGTFEDRDISIPG